MDNHKDHKGKVSGDIIERVKSLLEQDKVLEALDFVNHLGQETALIKNARGVCLLRLGRGEAAVSEFREITFRGFMCVPSDTPVVYQTNFATAMLMANQKAGAIELINRLDNSQHAAVVKIKSAIDQWKRGLNPLRRFLCKVDVYPNKAVQIDFVPGDLQ